MVLGSWCDDRGVGALDVTCRCGPPVRIQRTFAKGLRQTRPVGDGILVQVRRFVALESQACWKWRCTVLVPDRLLMEANVALIPGESFGNNGKGYLRLSYAAGLDEIEEALSRMHALIGASV